RTAQLSRPGRRGDDPDPRSNRHWRSVAEFTRPKLPERRGAAAAILRSERHGSAVGVGPEKAQRHSREWHPGGPPEPAGNDHWAADGEVHRSLGGYTPVQRSDQTPRRRLP